MVFIFSRIFGQVSDAVLSSQSIQAESREQGQVLCPPESILIHGGGESNNGDAIVLLVRHTVAGNLGHPWHLPLRYHPPVIITLHLKFIFHMKFVGPVDVRSLNTPSGRVILSPPLPI